MATFDSASKRQVQNNPRDFVAFCFKQRNIADEDFTEVELITPEQPTVQMHQADVVIKVKLRGKYVLVHFEIQTADSFDPPMALRMASYILWLARKYRMDVYANVIYLRPDAGRNDPGRFIQDIPGHSIFVEYQVIRLAEVEGQPVLDAKTPGLLPFTPLMKPPVDIDKDEWLRRCIQTADSVDVPDKLTDLGVMTMLGNLAYDREKILEIIRRYTMHEIPILQYMSVQVGREFILDALELRLHPDAALAFKPLLETIEDPQRIKQLFHAAIQVTSVEDFQKVLEANSD